MANGCSEKRANETDRERVVAEMDFLRQPQPGRL